MDARVGTRHLWRPAKTLRAAVTVAMLAVLVVAPIPASAALVTANESEPNDTPAQATPITTDGTIMLGEYATPDDEDWYSVDLEAGTKYWFEMGPHTDQLDTNTDTYLYLYAPDGITELTRDDDAGPDNYAHFTYTPTSDGTYYLRTHYYAHDDTGKYGLRVRIEGDFVAEGAITGTVRNESDEPLEDVRVTLHTTDEWFAELDPSFLIEYAETSTGVDGTYSAPCRAVTQRVGFEDTSGAYYPQYYDGYDYIDDADDVVVAMDETVEDIDAYLIARPIPDTDVVDTTRASVSASGIQGSRGSRSADISADGRYVAFYSGNAFVPADENGLQDYYVKDMETGGIVLASVATDGTQANLSFGEGDGKIAISDDGRYVAFDSPADTLVEDDENGSPDVFVRDLVENTTTRVSVMSAGSEAYGDSTEPAISADGRYVAFASNASLVEDDNNGAQDIYVHDMVTGTTSRVSLDHEGAQVDGNSWGCSISGNGDYIAFTTSEPLVPEDENGYGDVYVVARAGDSVVRASVAFDGGDPDDSCDDATISDNGLFVTFVSTASNLLEDGLFGDVPPGEPMGLVSGEGGQLVYVRDLDAEWTDVASITSDGEIWDFGWNAEPVISADGRMVAFSSNDDMLVYGDENGSEDIVVHDMMTGRTTVGSVSLVGVGADDSSYQPAISPDGEYIAFDSYASNLVTDDTNDVRDVFVAHVIPTVPVEGGLAGTDRYGTAVAISQDTFRDGSAEAVVIATGANWPDALGGSALAGAVGGPILLTTPDELLPIVADEIERLGASSAYVLGGANALSDDVVMELEDLLGPDSTMRIGGATRYETAEEVAAEVVSWLGEDYDGTAFVATGEDFADALAASPLAAYNIWPVYLARKPVIAPTTIQAMNDAGVEDVILLGGEAAMPEGTSVSILEAGFTAYRIDGVNRYDTAAKVAAFGVDEAGLDWASVALATGETYADALAGGPAQAMVGSAMLLSTSETLAPHAAAAIEDHKSEISDVRFLGGPQALSMDVHWEVSQILE